MINTPQPNFVSKTATWTGTLTPCRDLFTNGEYPYADTVLESTPMKDSEWSYLFAYMHRRFGPPHVGGDDYKDLSAGWMISSPDPELFLSVSPGLSGAEFSLSPYVVTGSSRFDRRAVQNLPVARLDELKAAYRSALLDLLRPVCVRDSWINALGEVDDDSPLMVCDADDELVHEAKRHESSGFSMPLGLFGGKDWVALVSMIRHLGEGDMEAGRKAAITALRKDVFADARRENGAVKRLMVLGAGEDREIVKKGLQLSADEIVTLEAELSSLREPDAAKGALIAQMDALSVKTSVELLGRLGLASMGLRGIVEQLRINHAVDESFRALSALRSGEFPDVKLPADPYGPATELVAHLKKGFAKEGYEEFSRWVDETMARPEGLTALRRIIAHVKIQQEQARIEKPVAKKKSPAQKR